jgi:hypothetical protein
VEISTRAVCLLLILTSSCGDRALRGKAVKSPDSQTYLVIKEVAYEECDLMLDGTPWPSPVGVAGGVEAGVHTIACGPDDSGIGFEVEEGTTFYFDYWGP